MKNRCENVKHSSYPHYGDRGIKICNEWRRDYGTFKKWAYENGYVEGLTIDRIDIDGDYEPTNCRWVTKAENNLEMLQRRYSSKSGAFSVDSILKLTNINRSGLGAKFKMYVGDIEVSEYRCLSECAEYIIKTKSLSTCVASIKKNISACLNGKRNKCHGFTFERIE